MVPIDMNVLLAAGGGDCHAEAVEEKSEPDKKHYEALVRDMPWLQHLEHKRPLLRDLDSSLVADPESVSTTDIDDSAAVPEIDDETLLQGLADLEKARSAAVQDNAEMGADDFVSRVRGGASTATGIGQGVDAMQGHTTNQLVKARAVRRGLQVTFKASFSEHGVAASKVLVRSWCHRMQFFFDLELRSDEGANLEYNETHVSSYLESSELQALEVDGHNPKWVSRIEFIRRIPFP